MGSSKRTPRARTRPAAGSRSTRTVARVAAPVVFLVAIIALIGIVVGSGVLGGSDEPVTTPATAATKAQNGSTSTTKKYVVKSGDSLSSIAVRFDTSTSELVDLNPDLDSSSTLVVGQRIVVPRK
jgi:LysM repeat protein